VALLSSAREEGGEDATGRNSTSFSELLERPQPRELDELENWWAEFTTFPGTLTSEERGTLRRVGEEVAITHGIDADFAQLDDDTVLFGTWIG